MEKIFIEILLRPKKFSKGQDISQSSSQDQRWYIFPQIILNLERQLQSSFKSRIRIRLPLLKQGCTAFKHSTKAIRHDRFMTCTFSHDISLTRQTFLTGAVIAPLDNYASKGSEKKKQTYFHLY